MKLSELVLSHGEDNEATGYPIWGIVRKAGLNRLEFVAGFWFNRKDATNHLESKRYNYKSKAFVYCFSGHASLHVKELYKMARAEVKE